MKATIQKWGNSLALRIPAVVAREISVGEGDSVELKVGRDSLVIRPTQRVYRLEDLVKGITAKNQHTETDWGRPVGKEIW